MSHKEALTFAHAALQELIGHGNLVVAAALRQDIEDLEGVRRNAHDLLDSYMDHMTSVAHFTRQGMGGD